MTDKPLSQHEKKVFDLLSSTSKPLSAYDILAGLREEGVRSPPTVYRALESLAHRGFIHRLESLSAFVACRCGSRAHKAGHGASFAICTQCGRVSEIEDAQLRQTIHAAGHGFLATVEEEVLEIRGLCRSCCKAEPTGCSCSH